MTTQEFKQLKVGDRVFIPTFRKGKMMSTEVLEIDRIFQKVRVLPRRGFLSYRYIRKRVKEPVGCYVGLDRFSFERFSPQR